MKYFKLGKYNVSRYCLGTWSLGGNKKKNISYGKISTSEVNKILDYSYNNGINFFDTANVYGDSEKKIGSHFYKNRDKVFFATKVGCVSFAQKLNFSKKKIQFQIDNSLKNLKSDYIDIVQLYNPRGNEDNLKYSIELLDKLKNKHKIKFIGISLGQPSDYLNLRKIYKFDTVQCNFNVLDQRILENEIIQKIKKDEVKIFARTILNFGIFTEKFLKKKIIKFSKKDHRYYWDLKQIKLWIRYIKKIKLYSNRLIENTCYKFCNSHQIDSSIIGANSISHLKSAIVETNYLKLNKKELEYISQVYKDYSKNEIIKPKIGMKPS
jgi:aryl-alcohol dehydrogenase-like predicted oxidoreductase